MPASNVTVTARVVPDPDLGESPVIRVIVAHRGVLIRRLLAHVLEEESDIRVVAELGSCDEITPAALREDPHVAILDYAMQEKSEIYDTWERLSEAVPECRLLVVMDRATPSLAGAALARMVPRVGLLTTDASPGQFIDSVRRLSRGQSVLDTDIAVAALTAPTHPLTDRERDVLLLAADGVPAKDIAARLFLTDGTVRNYLSRITAKTGGRTLVEAIRRAEEAGWV
ncbi:response regulator transcription factor [Actinoplanes siamensis]|uniref:response regulator transcription factor n=1 Tax=Actinoplanes siamensis TaxID=1223317 RepID=UPI001EF234F0|nr:response regulator transcription factor [Actinoplanes siamensis]